MSEHAFWNPNSKANESGVSVYSKADERFAGWSSLPEPRIVRVAFSADNAPVFETRTEADLVFTGTGEIRLFVPRATVFSCEYVPGQVVYLFRVRDTQWDNIRESLSPRRSIRIKPSAPIVLKIASASGALAGEIFDLSESGVSVHLECEYEKDLLRPGLHSIHFALPDGEEPLELMAQLRYRASEAEESVRCGFEFDAQASEDLRAKRWRISRYVWSQQEDEEDES